MDRKRNGKVLWLSTHSPTNYSSSSLSPLASHRKNRVGKKGQRSAQTGRLEESKEEEEEEKFRSDRSVHIQIVADNVSVLICWKKTKIKTKQSEFYGKSATQSFSCTTTDTNYNQYLEMLLKYVLCKKASLAEKVKAK